MERWLERAYRSHEADGGEDEEAKTEGTRRRRRVSNTARAETLMAKLSATVSVISS